MKNFLKYVRDGGWHVFVLVLLLYILFTGYPCTWALCVTTKMMELTGWSHTHVVYVQVGIITVVCLTVLLAIRRKKRSV